MEEKFPHFNSLSVTLWIAFFSTNHFSVRKMCTIKSNGSVVLRLMQNEMENNNGGSCNRLLITLSFRFSRCSFVHWMALQFENKLLRQYANGRWLKRKKTERKSAFQSVQCSFINKRSKKKKGNMRRQWNDMHTNNVFLVIPNEFLAENKN